MSTDGIRERYDFIVADGDMSRFKSMYACMHIFPPSTTGWMVGDDAGKVVKQGEFTGSRKMLQAGKIRWASVYAPSVELATLILYPESYDGSNAFWDRASDNKHYLTVKPKLTAGSSSSYEIHMRAVKVSPDDWQKTVMQVMQSELRLQATRLVE